ncbi:MAG: hypothetical protein AAF696_27855 [Bacteroidota bacterium]
MNLRIRQLIRFLLSPETRPQRNNRAVVFLFAFLSALALWMIVTLNEEYETSLRYTVRLPENVRLGSEEAPSIRIDAKGSGIDLMLARIRSRKDTLSFDFTEEEIKEGYILVKEHEDQVKSNLQGVKIAALKPDKLYFDYLNDFANTVPLEFGTELNLAPAYQLEEEPELDEDSVLLRGPKEVIDTIKSWKTTGRVDKVITDASSFEVQVLDTLEGIDVYPKYVNVEVKPIKYTEIKLDIPIEIQDKPLGLKVRLSHDSINYTCLVPMDEYSRMERLVEKLRIIVPFDQLDENIPNFIPKAELPASLKLIRMSPLEVNFVLVYPTELSP